MPIFSFKTIKTSATGIYKEKGSKFLSFAYPVTSEEEIKELIEWLKKKYFDARHHCFAWILGPDKNSYRAFDDGEPNHSAGDPILGQIRSKELTNTLVVVVRYFGGIKLGVGGLISAYKAATADALEHATIIEQEVLDKMSIRFEYDSTPEVMRMVKEFKLIIIEQLFDDNCTLTFSFKLEVKDVLVSHITLLQQTGHAIEIVENNI